LQSVFTRAFSSAKTDPLYILTRILPLHITTMYITSFIENK
jgi:hypothetical protein